MSSKEAQDRAAGGEELRKVLLADGTQVTASVSVQIFKTGHNKWGYFRFKTGGKTVQRYIGKVNAEPPDESLTLGWKLVRERRVVERSGWSWLIQRKSP